ncbi:MAG: DUF3488 domain-containing protein [Gammaproteobacteria bacterium]|nr:MAG: DUF3488 domain-containing protein [Gammaproteobacteria bacterium]
MNTVPRHSLAWFFIAQAAVLAPHIPRLPWWLMGVWLVCAVWRIQVFRGHWSWPGKLAKSLIVFAVLIGILAWYRNPTALESAAGTIIALFFLKMLECYQRRDVYLLVFVAFFVAAIAFLFDQGLLTSLWVFFSVCLVWVSLVSLHEPQGSSMVTTLSAVRPVMGMLLQALPIMLVLFLVFPRLAPMWTVPVPGGGQARTGMSDSMSPGEVSQLARSSELAFRVAFEGQAPDAGQLYWRGLVLNHFDGRTWSPGYVGQFQWDAKQVIDANHPYRYEVLMEPTGAQWLFGLGMSQSSTDGVFAMSNGTLVSRRAVTSRLRYQVGSSLVPHTETLSPLERLEALRLPEAVNPQTREWAAGLRDSHADESQRIAAILRYFREQPFYYSLEAPLLGRHSVDEFLFQTRKGFCEHYAGSMAFALRAAGIPARVLVGYQGAESNGEYWLVHQHDAHAWVEAWVGGSWQRIDPTSAVAPERVERGMRSWLNQSGETGFGAAEWMHRYAMLAQVRLLFDRLDYQWQRWVMGYDAERQAATLINLLGEINPARLTVLMLAVFGLAIGGVLLSVWSREWLRKRDPLADAYLRFCTALAREGLPRSAGEAPGDYAARVSEARPDLAAQVQSIHRLYESMAYKALPDEQYQQGVRLLRTQVRRFVRESLFSRSHNHKPQRGAP